jgi:hypothetical protein
MERCVRDGEHWTDPFGILKTATISDSLREMTTGHGDVTPDFFGITVKPSWRALNPDDSLCSLWLKLLVNIPATHFSRYRSVVKCGYRFGEERIRDKRGPIQTLIT